MLEYPDKDAQEAYRSALGIGTEEVPAFLVCTY